MKTISNHLKVPINMPGPYIAGIGGGGRRGGVSCPRQENIFSNIVFDFAGLLLVAILV